MERLLTSLALLMVLLRPQRLLMSLRDAEQTSPMSRCIDDGDVDNNTAPVMFGGKSDKSGTCT